MNKDFSEDKLLSFNEKKIFKVLFDLAHFIEKNKEDTKNTHFQKLQKYHQYLSKHQNEYIQKLNKEFKKIVKLDYQFQIYLMNLERFIDITTKEYDFLKQKDSLEPKKVLNYEILLDSIRSAHNIGAIFRNAECFGVKHIHLCGLSPTPKKEQVKKTSMGTDELVSWSYSKDAIEKVKKLKKLGYKIYAVDTMKNALLEKSLHIDPNNSLFIFGHEQYGIAPSLIDLCDEYIKISLYGNKNSLNVAVASGIILNKVSSLF
ncbi:MAG: hypothetical protein N4A33_06020 [Bacteriovoracaceae bacterium]|jgi:tRNA G18 (ribose-2'-O)-methylase SpoU|nr:hypothetical protein [Bacteriovoracaceae bacterium]